MKYVPTNGLIFTVQFYIQGNNERLPPNTMIETVADGGRESIGAIGTGTVSSSETVEHGWLSLKTKSEQIYPGNYDKLGWQLVAQW